MQTQKTLSRKQQGQIRQKFQRALMASAVGAALAFSTSMPVYGQDIVVPSDGNPYINTVTVNGALVLSGELENRSTGVINNGAVLYGGRIDNFGTVNNGATVRTGAYFLNRNSGAVNGNSLVENGASFDNDGTVVNVTVDGRFNNRRDPGATPPRNGNVTGTATINVGGELNNDGAVNDAIVRGKFDNRAGATLNTGTFISGTSYNAGTITTADVSGALLYNLADGTVTNANVSGTGILNNAGSITVASVSGGVLNNTGGITDGATVTGGVLNNSGGITGNIAGSGNGHFHQTDGTVNGGINLTGNATLNLEGGTVGGAINLQNYASGGVGAGNLSGNNGVYTRDVTANQQITNSGDNAFTVGQGGISGNSNTVNNTLSNGGAFNPLILNSGSGQIAVGNGAITGNSNSVTNTVNGNLSQTGSGAIIIGGATITGNGNNLTNYVGDITASGGTVSARFNNLHSSDNTSEDNLGHQTLTGAGTTGEYGANDVVLGAFSDNNTDTINVDGIEATDEATVLIGGGRHSVIGNGNKYTVNVNTRTGDDYALDLTDGASAIVAAGDHTGGVNPITGSNNTFGNAIAGNVNVDGESTLTLYGGRNRVEGNNNLFGNIIIGDVTVTGDSELYLDAGRLDVHGTQHTGNRSGNAITGNVSLVGSDAWISGQTTDEAGGSNSSGNTIGGVLSAEDSDIYVTGHNNNINVELDDESTLTIHGEDIINTRAGIYENSINGDVALNGGGVGIGESQTIQGSSGSNPLSANDNKITNTIRGEITNLDQGGSIALGSGLDITGNRNVVENVLNQEFTLGNNLLFVQGGYMDVDGDGNELNNRVVGDLRIETTASTGDFGIFVQTGGQLETASGANNNQINNIIEGNVVVTGADSAFVQWGGSINDSGSVNDSYSASDSNGNQITNLVDGSVTVESDAVYLIEGERNIVTDGVTTTSSSGTHIGGSDFSDDNITLNNESTANHIVTGGGHLHLGTNPDGFGAQEIEGDNNTITNRVVGDGDYNIEGSITVEAGSTLGLGDGLHGALEIDGSGNTINNIVGSENTLSGDAQLQTVVDGEVLLGGRTVTTTGTGNTVNNLINQDVELDESTLHLVGAGSGTSTSGVQINNTVTGNVTADAGSVVAFSDSNDTNVFNTIAGRVDLNDDSMLLAWDGGAAGLGNVVTDDIYLNGTGGVVVGSGPVYTNENHINSLNGNIRFENSDAYVGIGSGLVGNDGGTHVITNTHFGAITSLTAGGDWAGGQVVLAGSIDSTNNTNNTITNRQSGFVSLLGDDSEMLLTGEFNGNGTGINTINNTVEGSVSITASGGGLLRLESNQDTTSGNTINNTITGMATLSGAADVVVTGANNAIVDGLVLNTTTTSFILPTGGNERNDVTKAIIGIGDTGSALNELTANVTIHANPNTIPTFGPSQRAGDLGYDVDSGHLYVGGFVSNTAGAGESITNRLDGNVTLTGTAGTNPDGTNNYRNSGGMVVLGASNHTLSGDASVLNEIDGNVTLNGGSRLHLGGDEIIGNDAGSSVTNRITGDVTLNGNSFGAMWGENDARLSNKIDGALTLNDNVFFRIEGVNNEISDGTTLTGNAYALVGGSGGAHTPITNVASSFTLGDQSTLQLGSLSEFQNEATIENNIDGDVTLSDNARLRVLSGGSGNAAWHSAEGKNTISGDLVLSSGNTFEVSAGFNTITGVEVGGDATLGDATVQVNHAGDPFTFGRRYSLVETTGSVSGEFNEDVLLANADGSVIYTHPAALALRLGYTPDSTYAYLDWMTDFQGVGQTKNQKSFGGYLDRLVDDAMNDGIDSNSDLGILLNSMIWNDNPNSYNNYLGDTYAAFDAAAYLRSSRFANMVAQRTLQSGRSDWAQEFALNSGQGTTGLGAQMSLARQLLSMRPGAGLSANGDGSSSNGLWADVSGERVRNSGDSSLGSPEWRMSTKAVAVGYQMGSERFRWGLTGGFNKDELTFANRSASGESDGWDVALNALWQRSEWYANGVVSYGRDKNDLTRRTPLGNNKSDFRSHNLSALLEAGKRIELREDTTLTPYLSVLGVKAKRDEVSEGGSGVGGLNIGSSSRSYLTTRLGVRLNQDYYNAAGWNRGGVMLGVSWIHQSGDTALPVRASLQSAPGGGNYTVWGTPLSKNALGVQLGGYARLSESVLGFLNYNGSYSSNQKAHSIAAGVEYRF